MLNQIVSIIEKVDIEEKKTEEKEDGGDANEDETAEIGGASPPREEDEKKDTNKEPEPAQAQEAIATPEHRSAEAETLSDEMFPSQPTARSITPASIDSERIRQMYTAKLAELEEVLLQYHTFKVYVTSCFEAYQSQLEKMASGNATECLVEQIKNHELPKIHLASKDIQIWADGIRQEAVTELHTAGPQIQNLMQTVKELSVENGALEVQIDGLRSQLAKQQVEAPPKEIAIDIDAPQEKVAVHSDYEKLKSKLCKMSGEMSEKQAMLSALYNEKEELRARLEAATVKLELCNTVPQHQVDESKFFQSLAGRGRWGMRITTTASRVDFYTMRFGKFLYSNAVIRVLIAMYLIMIHLWVFFVITSYVHMLPHMSQNVHDHVA
eukprot:TRINITY_DN12172_c0_g3_i1.p1 TRINITY_DN12172_c0_g3~~TRINITY_DN12172_c0_g3_i1.p1  ORF type:complete len:382 (+),score=103.42 TRINITY_DN12172_c0_g3_i1:70-1215(+)